MIKNPPAHAGDSGGLDSISGSGRSPGGGNGNPLQYSYPGNHLDRGAVGGYCLWGHKESVLSERLSSSSNRVKRVVSKNSSGLPWWPSG